ncbi:MAG: methionyl-tRNA formyltransferase [Bacillota bacterium]|nr:methionyl-tRNA formyltransferase [Thermoanaerobacteraceae bacterium]
MRVVFMGTPEFAVPALEALVHNGYPVALVVTQPDRPKGRRGQLTPPPVKEVAVAHGIPVLQPVRLKAPGFLEELRRKDPEVIVVVAYGKILPLDVLALPKYGCINVHASLLPKYRGAAPVQRALMNGERETGITTILMDEGLDTGDILLQRPIAVGEDESFGSLYGRLAHLGAEVLLETLKLLEAGNLPRRPQEHGLASFAPPLTPRDEIICWNRPAQAISNQVRALDPFPGARTFWEGRILKVWRAKPVRGSFAAVPGEVLETGPEGILVRAGEGAVLIQELQLAGGRRLPAAAFLSGRRLSKGARLGH